MDTSEVVIDTDAGTKTIKVMGKRLYVRQCVKPDPEYIVLPEKSREGNFTATVLGIGSEWPIETAPVEFGQKVLLYQNHEAIQRMPWKSRVELPDGSVKEQSCDFMVAEDAIIALLDAP